MENHVIVGERNGGYSYGVGKVYRVVNKKRPDGAAVVDADSAADAANGAVVYFRSVKAGSAEAQKQSTAKPVGIDGAGFAVACVVVADGGCIGSPAALG